MFALQVASLKGTGGVYTSLYHYHCMWSELGISTSCLYRGPKANLLKELGLSVISAPRSLTKEYFPVTIDRFLLGRSISRIHGEKPDFILAHSDRSIKAMRLLFPDAVIITRCHSDNTKHKGDADIVITLNPDQHRRVSDALRNTRARTVMAGHPYIAQGLEPVRGGVGTVRVNFVGRLVDVKAPFTFTDAMEHLASDLAFSVRVIGDGPLRAEMERRLSASGRDVTFTGWRDDPLADFTGDDILVLPSRWEGLPWLLLEALERGIPIISSDVAGNLHALDDGAYGEIFPVDDAVELSRALSRVIADPGEARSKALLGRASLPSRFGPQCFWDQVLSVLPNKKAPAEAGA